MAQQCAGCDTPIPYGASKCPMCGAPATITPPPATNHTQPIRQPIVQHVTEVHHHHGHQNDKPIQIEKTGKKWKQLYLYAWGCFLLSFMGCVAGAGGESPGAMGVSGILFVIGIGIYIRARAGAWWNHG